MSTPSEMEENRQMLPDLSQYIRHYSPESMDFLLWQNGFEYLLEFFNVPEEETVNYLLRMMKPEIIKDIEKKVAPDDPTKLPYDKLISKLQEMYASYNGFDAAKYRFVNRYQMIGETVSQYVTALQTLLNNCSPDFRESDILQHQFNNGLRSIAAKSILEKENDISFEKSVNIAKQLELCEIKLQYHGF